MMTTGSLAEAFAASFGGPPPDRRAFAPYRLSPLGAHTDHQLGLTSGFTLDVGIELRFRVRDDGCVRLRSLDVPGEVAFPLAAIPSRDGTFGDYVRGIAVALAARTPLANGLDGVLAGALPSGGISSSAALEVAFLLALAAANGISLPRQDAMHLVVEAERRYAGVAVGLLDPAVILFGKKDALVVIDCREGIPRAHAFAKSMPPREWILVDSGLPRDLRSSPYNERVLECRAAARALGATGDAPVLRDVLPETFRRDRGKLAPVLARRAEHFFSEHKRVQLGLTALSHGDLDGFGRLIDASGDSLTRFFECGTTETRALLGHLRRVPGVLGASYAGGGFGGLVQAIARPGTADAVRRLALPAYCAEFPALAASPSVRVVLSGPGATVE